MAHPVLAQCKPGDARVHARGSVQAGGPQQVLRSAKCEVNIDCEGAGPGISARTLGGGGGGERHMRVPHLPPGPAMRTSPAHSRWCCRPPRPCPGTRRRMRAKTRCTWPTGSSCAQRGGFERGVRGCSGVFGATNGGAAHTRSPASLVCRVQEAQDVVQHLAGQGRDAHGCGGECGRAEKVLETSARTATGAHLYSSPVLSFLASFLFSHFPRIIRRKHRLAQSLQRAQSFHRLLHFKHFTKFVMGSSALRICRLV